MEKCFSILPPPWKSGVPSPSQAGNAIIGKKFSYSCFEHPCVRSGMEIFVLTVIPRWCTYMVSLSWWVRQRAALLCAQLGISRRMRAFLPESLMGPPVEFMNSTLTQLQSCPLEPRALLNLLHTSECCWGGSAELKQLTVQPFWRLIKVPEIHVAGIAWLNMPLTTDPPQGHCFLPSCN